MLRAALVRVSLLCALVPLASACAEAEPDSALPDGPMTMGPRAGALSHSPGAPPAESSVPATAYVFPRQATLFGESYEGWAARWWQWVTAIPKSVNPNEGGPCDVDQSGEVFFLGGNFGGTSSRSCALPAGKAIFFPILNSAVAQCPELAGEGYTCEVLMSEDQLHDITTGTMDLDKTLTLEIDGQAVDGLDEYRAHSDTFASLAPEDMEDRVWTICAGPIRDNACGVLVGSEREVVTDGYWVMLRPLPPGDHQIHFASSVIVSGQTVFSLDITYDLVVSP
jgi:hypothetical protein